MANKHRRRRRAGRIKRRVACERAVTGECGRRRRGEHRTSGSESGEEGERRQARRWSKVAAEARLKAAVESRERREKE